jgi:hypothetical protein
VQLKSFVLEGKCLKCHDGSDEFSYDLGTYAKVVEKIQVVRACVLLPVTDRRRMPYGRRSPQLTDVELVTLLAWIDGGYPEKGTGNWQPPANPQPTPIP